MILSEDAIERYLDALSDAFANLETKVPAPRPTLIATGVALRYREQTIEQALIQKLARQTSGLRVIQLTLSKGFNQEQAVIQRSLDEINEDIVFLSYAILRREQTELHKTYLREFWAEEFDQPDPMKGSRPRFIVPRKKIRSYVNRIQLGGDTSTADTVSKTIHTAYSGFVHAASPQVMDMCVGDPPRFQVNGMRYQERLAGYERDSLNYYYRALASTAIAAKALSDDNKFHELYNLANEFFEVMSNL